MRWCLRRATLAGILADHALDRSLAARMIEAVREVFDPRRIRVGNSYRLVVGNDGSLRRFEYHVDNDQYLEVRGTAGPDGAFEVQMVPYVKERAEWRCGV